VKKLTETEYEEEQVNVITHNWAKGLKGAHTLSFANKLTVVDAMVTKRKW